MEDAAFGVSKAASFLRLVRNCRTDVECQFKEHYLAFIKDCLIKKPSDGFKP
jgi:hypothetical protein